MSNTIFNHNFTVCNLANVNSKTISFHPSSHSSFPTSVASLLPLPWEELAEAQRRAMYGSASASPDLPSALKQLQQIQAAHSHTATVRGKSQLATWGRSFSCPSFLLSEWKSFAEAPRKLFLPIIGQNRVTCPSLTKSGEYPTYIPDTRYLILAVGPVRALLVRRGEALREDVDGVDHSILSLYSFCVFLRELVTYMFDSPCQSILLNCFPLVFHVIFSSCFSHHW